MCSSQEIDLRIYMACGTFVQPLQMECIQVFARYVYMYSHATVAKVEMRKEICAKLRWDGDL